MFCGKCGGKLIRKDYKGIKGPYWKCGNSKKDKDKKCKEELIREGALESAAVEAWNRGIEKNAEKWNRAAVEGNALERYRARLMIAVAAEGKMEVLGDEMTRMFLEEIVVISPTELVVKFLDGSKESISIP